MNCVVFNVNWRLGKSVCLIFRFMVWNCYMVLVSYHLFQVIELLVLCRFHFALNTSPLDVLNVFPCQSWSFWLETLWSANEWLFIYFLFFHWKNNWGPNVALEKFIQVGNLSFFDQQKIQCLNGSFIKLRIVFGLDSIKDLFVRSFKTIWRHSQQSNCQIHLEILNRLVMAFGILDSWHRINFQKVQKGLTYFSSQLMIGFYRIKFIRLFGCRISIWNNDLIIEFILIECHFLFINSFLRLENIRVPIHVIVALQSPAKSIFSRLKNCNSSSALFRNMVSSVLYVHVFLGKVASFVFKILWIHGQNLWEKTSFNLFLQLIRRVSINEHSLPRRMGMQVQKSKISAVFMKMHDNFFNCINRTVFFGTGIDVAAIQVDSIRINSIMSSCHSIWVQNWNDIKDRLISECICHLIVLCQLINDASHHMRAWNLSWMDSGCDDNAFFVTIKCLRFLLVDKQVLIIDWLLFVDQALFRTDCH